MVDTKPTIFIVTLNVNGLNVSFKKQKLSVYQKQKKQNIYQYMSYIYSTKYYFQYKGTYGFKINGTQN